MINRFSIILIVIISAAAAVIINRYIVKAYHIESDSMADTLFQDDRVIISRLDNITDIEKPERGDIVIYHDMVLIVKRVSGIEGDIVRFRKGNFEFLPSGFSEWIKETNTGRRTLTDADYVIIKHSAVSDAYNFVGIPSDIYGDDVNNSAGTEIDRYTWTGIRAETLYSMYPYNRRYGGKWRKSDLGWYIPEGYMFPLGDNRTNSDDARYSGPVRIDNIVGQVLFRYWPIERIGTIR